MTPFELVEPATLQEALKLIDPDDPTVRPVAGGTALMLMMKAGVFRPSRLISLRKLNSGLTGISAAYGALTIGAMTPLAALEHAAKLCMGLGTDGLRGELTLIRAARALAALEGEIGRAHV